MSIKCSSGFAEGDGLRKNECSSVFCLERLGKELKDYLLSVVLRFVGVSMFLFLNRIVELALHDFVGLRGGTAFICINNNRI